MKKLLLTLVFVLSLGMFYKASATHIIIETDDPDYIIVYYKDDGKDDIVYLPGDEFSSVEIKKGRCENDLSYFYS